MTRTRAAAGDVGGARNLSGRRVARATKRLIDIVGAAVLLVVLSPLLLAAALLILVRDGRPVLFRQTRIGRGGRAFTMVKFRTMVRDAEARLAELESRNQRQGGPLFKLDDDPRITPTGRRLRDSSLDELPQLWNVLVGQMSLVGPRPALPAEVELFDDELLARHRVRPGITGLWQVEARGDSGFDRYRQLDLRYVDTWTVGLDLSLLLRTAFATLGSCARTLTRQSRTRQHDGAATGGGDSIDLRPAVRHIDGETTVELDVASGV